jgi:hypothetical protein
MSVLLNGTLVAATPVLGVAGGEAAVEHDARSVAVTNASTRAATAGDDRRELRLMNP